MTNDIEDIYLSSSQVENIFGISKSTLNRWAWGEGFSIPQPLIDEKNNKYYDLEILRKIADHLLERDENIKNRKYDTRLITEDNINFRENRSKIWNLLIDPSEENFKSLQSVVLTRISLEKLFLVLGCFPFGHAARPRILRILADGEEKLLK